jgi:hypothetical protein
MPRSLRELGAAFGGHDRHGIVGSSGPAGLMARSEPMPVRAEHRRNLPHLRGQHAQPLLRNSGNINPQMQDFITAKLRSDTPWENIELLKTGENPWQNARIGFSS